MQQCETTTEITVKRVSVRSGGAGHTQSGVANGPASKNGSIAGASSNGCATVLRSTNNIVVKLGT